MTRHKLLLATRNKGKIEEFRRILEDIAAGEIELVGLESGVSKNVPLILATKFS